MKLFLLFISLLLLTSCNIHDILPYRVIGPKFKVGDCIASKEEVKSFNAREEWHKKYPLRAQKILIVGKGSYRTARHITKNYKYYSESEFIQDRYMQKVECPDTLKDVTKEEPNEQ